MEVISFILTVKVIVRGAQLDTTAREASEQMALKLSPEGATGLEGRVLVAQVGETLDPCEKLEDQRWAALLGSVSDPLHLKGLREQGCDQIYI